MPTSRACSLWYCRGDGEVWPRERARAFMSFAWARVGMRRRLWFCQYVLGHFSSKSISRCGGFVSRRLFASIACSVIVHFLRSLRWVCWSGQQAASKAGVSTARAAQGRLRAKLQAERVSDQICSAWCRIGAVGFVRAGLELRCSGKGGAAAHGVFSHSGPDFPQALLAFRPRLCPPLSGRISSVPVLRRTWPT